MFKVYDNFLANDKFEHIRNTLIGEPSVFPWYYKESRLPQLETRTEIPQQYAGTLSHMFYINNQRTSDFFELLAPLLDIIEPAALIRIKANLTFAAPDRFVHGMHIDHNKGVGQTAVFYVNTNNGQTMFDNGETVDSVANRLVVFDSSTVHSATSHTDTSVRCVINLNYIEQKHND